MAGVSSALAATDRPWWIAGGLALSLFVGREIRPHHDIDVVILEDDATAIRRALASWDVRAAVGWTGTPRASRRLLRAWPAEKPRPLDTSAFWCRPSVTDRWVFELLVNPHTDRRWEFKRDRALSRPLSEIGLDRDGIPYIVPEIVLLHKATSGEITEQDTSDLAAVMDFMTRFQKHWLAQAITRFAPNHPWLAALERGTPSVVPNTRSTTSTSRHSPSS